MAASLACHAAAAPVARPLFYTGVQAMADDRKLLVVDDEEVVCQACRRIFSRQGFQVEVNTDARQGLALATDKDYTIILLDIKMPNMNGIEFLERLREKKSDVPVLIITGYPSIPNAAAAMRLGACDYVTKPFTAEEITGAVQRVLSVRQVLSGESETTAGSRASARWSIRACRWPGSPLPTNRRSRSPRPSPALSRESTNSWRSVPTSWRVILAAKGGSLASARRDTRKWPTASPGGYCW